MWWTAPNQQCGPFGSDRLRRRRLRSSVEPERRRGSSMGARLWQDVFDWPRRQPRVLSMMGSARREYEKLPGHGRPGCHGETL